MNKIDKLISQYNISPYLNIENHQFELNENLLNVFHKNFPQYTKYINLNLIVLPSIAYLTNEKYPFIQNLNQSIVEEILQRNVQINNLIKNSILKQNSLELKFYENKDYKKTSNNAARSIIKNLNNFIYRKKIKKFWIDTVFINDNKKFSFIGNIDFLCTDGKNIFLILLKFSKTPFTNKYEYEAKLYKTLFKSTIGIEIDTVLVFNPFAEIFVSKI